MRRTSFAEMNCSIAQTLEVIGEWWTPLIVRDALMGVTRFEQFQSRLGIARNVLTQRLEHLVRHGILEAVPYQDHPVRYDYRLTEKGRDLWAALVLMRQWGDKWLANDGPPVQVIHSTCEQVTEARVVCAACGERLQPSHLELQPGPGALTPDVLPGRRDAG